MLRIVTPIRQPIIDTELTLNTDLVTAITLNNNEITITLKIGIHEHSMHFQVDAIDIETSTIYAHVDHQRLNGQIVKMEYL